MADQTHQGPSAEGTRQSLRARTLTEKAKQQTLEYDDASSQNDAASEIEVREMPPSTRTTGKQSATGKATRKGSTKEQAQSQELAIILAVMQDFKQQQQLTLNQLRIIQEELKETKEELKETKEQLHLLRHAQEQQASPQSSYAEVAKTPPTSRPSNIQTLSSGVPTPSNFTNTPFCTVDTTRMASDCPEKGNPGAIRAIVEKEMRATEGQEAWRCVAVSRDGKNPDRIRVICREETELKKVRAILESKTTPGRRVLRDQLYPVKVDNVNRTVVLSDRGEILPGTEESLGKENDVQVAKITWLSNKDNGKAYGSMAIYVTKGSDATKLLAAQYFNIAGESATTRPYEHRERPTQCYNCQELGHKAYACKNTRRCAKCAQDGHGHKDCKVEMVKCVPCGGPHESFSRNCPKLYPARNEQ